MPSPFLHPRQTSLIENQFPLTTLRFQLNTGFVQQLQPMQYYPASHHCPICQLLATSQDHPPQLLSPFLKSTLPLGTGSTHGNGPDGCLAQC